MSKPKRIKRYITQLLAIVLILPLFSGLFTKPIEVKAASYTGSFTFVINQTSGTWGGGAENGGRDGECFTCAYEAIFQNACNLPAGYQMTGVATCQGHPNWSSWQTITKARLPLDCMNSINEHLKEGDKWEAITPADQNYKVDSSYIITGWNGKALKDYSYSECVTILKYLYNGGYWCTIGVWDGQTGQGHENACAGTDHPSRHTVMFAGIDNEGNAMMLDSAAHTEEGNKPLAYKLAHYLKTGDSAKPNDCSGCTGDYGLDNPITYFMVFKNQNEKYSLMNMTGGKAATLTTRDIENSQTLNLNHNKGYFSEDDISAGARLSEMNLSSIITEASIDNLTGDQLEALNNWTTLTKEDSTTVKIVRGISQLVGILLLLWALFMYVGFWFDRTNNFIDISLVSLLTLGKLRLTDTDEEAGTFGKNDTTTEKQKVATINHRGIILICVVALTFGTLILTGMLYTILSKLVNWVLRFFGSF